MKLTFGTLPSGVQAGTTTEVTFDITDDDDPQVTVSFGAGAYTVAEGGTQAVTVTLSADPERTVDIPLVATYEGGATAADYSGVPASLTFDAGVLLKTITFTATQDTEDDDDERVLLAFASLPDRVSAGTTNQVTFDITDDDDPQVTVSFGQAAYTVAEGETVTVRVTLSADPERTVAILLTATNQGATSADYSGVPASLTFNTGETLKTIPFLRNGGRGRRGRGEREAHLRDAADRGAGGKDRRGHRQHRRRLQGSGHLVRHRDVRRHGAFGGQVQPAHR